MSISRRMEWPEPRDLASLESLSEYCKLLYLHLTEESNLRKTDVEREFHHTTTKHIGGEDISTLPTAKIDDAAITAAKIAALAVEEAKIAADAVTALKLNVAAIHGTTGAIVSDHIIAGMLQTDCVTEAKVLADAITATKIAVSGLDGTTGSVATNHIIAGMIQTDAITSAKILADAVTASKINVVGLDGTSGRIIVADTTDANVVSGGINSYATTLIAPGKVLISGATVLSDWSHGTDATLIDGGDVYANSITATQIAALTITAAEIASNAITGVKILADAVTATKINVVGLDGATGRIVVTDATDANVVTAGINTHAVTLINAGKILISGAVPLSDWSHATDATLIDGGEIYANSIAINKLTTGLSPNLIKSKYSDFQSFVNGANIGSGVTRGTATCDTSDFYIGDRCLKMVASAADSFVYLGSSATDYNIRLKPSTKYIVSYYAKAASGTPTVAGFIKQDDAAHKTLTPTAITTSWVRYQFEVTTDANLTDSGILRIDNDTSAATVWFDGIQVEEASVAASPEATPYKPSGTVEIYGGQIEAATITATEIAADAVTATKIDVAGLDGTTGYIKVSDATAANIVTAGINASATTLITPGKVLISGAVNLDDWSHASDATLIDGGDIYTGSVTAAKITVDNLAAINADMGTITAGSMDAARITAGTLSVTRTAAKCTDANADQTSANTAADTTAVNGLASSSVSGWAHASNTTLIDGGDIYTNSITATQIAAGTITADEITAGTITADEIKIAGITMDRLSTTFSEAFDGLSTAAIDGQGSYEMAGAWATTASASCTAAVVVKSGADKMLRLTDNNASGAVSTKVTYSADKEVVVGVLKFKARVSALGKYGYIGLHKSGTRFVRIVFDTDNDIKIRDSAATATVLQAWAANTWYAIKVHFDAATGKASVFIDNVFISQVTMDFQYAYYADEIKVSTDVAPTGAYTFDVDDLFVLNQTI